MQQQQEVELEASSHDNKASPSPSFSSYSSETLAEIAARVIEELRRDPHSSVIHDDDDDDDDIHHALFPPWDQNDTDNNTFAPQNDDSTDQNDDFEFAFVARDLSSPVSADDIFYNGQIKPMYPIFGVPVPLNGTVSRVSNNTPEGAIRRRLPLRKLMFEEGETASCSSSTDDSVDLEGATEGAYCVWNPNSVGTERKKSNSTGSASKRWKLRNLLLRSHSDGKDKKQQQQQQQQQQEVVFEISKKKVAAKHENRSVGTTENGGGEQNKKKSFLPYRPELVGLFANVNGLGRNLRPF